MWHASRDSCCHGNAFIGGRSVNLRKRQPELEENADKSNHVAKTKPVVFSDF